MGAKEESLNEFIAESVSLVDARLDEIIPSADTEPAKLHSAIRHSLFAGGKRFRPAFLLAVGRTLSVPGEKLLSVAAAIEMIHTYSLIHDDLPAMDDDDLRRGRATCHVKYGEATAILAGDALETFAFQAIAEEELLPAEIRVRLISEIARGAGTPSGMVAGQQVDLESEGRSISVDELERIHREKTGAMIEVSGRVPAIVAGSPEDELNAITDFSSSLGLLFQITDDLLDVTQSTETLGKTAGKDIASEKATYPSFYGIDGTRKLADRVYRDSMEALERVNGRTGLLAEIAKYILHRNN